jgi:hypothetical protein
MTIQDEDTLPVCNFCEKQYDPFDRHTCPGNNIEPEKKPHIAKLKTFEEVQARLREDYAKHSDGGQGLADIIDAQVLDNLRATDELIGWATDAEARALLGIQNPPIGRQQHCPACAGQSFACEAHYDRRHPPSALNTQPGGDHYRKLPIQPVEYIIANGLGFLAGNVIKYATRYKDKGGAEDIRKIKHYCDLILEFEYKEKS